VALAPTADVLADLVAARPPGQVVVGFAAETGDRHAGWLEHGRRKLARKQVDVLVVNPVGEGLAFEQKENSGVVLTADGAEVEVPPGPKANLAATVWTLVADRLH
jgi:phosphopantothenoylcysteine decarboxylase/phosphopantothenate--cysteine ligase